MINTETVKIAVAQKEKFDKEKIKDAIDIAGSAVKLARILGVGVVAVYAWVHGRSAPDPINCLKIQKATGGKIKARDIRPDYEWDKVLPDE